MNRYVSAATCALACACALWLFLPEASAQWQLESKTGEQIKLGFLAQPQMEWLETPAGGSYSQNVFLRRFRILFGGKLNDHWQFFFETDSPNLGKANPDPTANPTGAKDAGTIYMQDVLVTYSYNDALKIDMGLMLVPLSRNHQQSGATLLAVDYGPYTFVESTPMGARFGRDYGVQVRGYPLRQHLEYRGGVFQGVRGPQALNALRVIGRAVWYPFEADTGFFYAGTFHGTKKVLAVGAQFDTQNRYRSYGADVFAEQPIRGGEMAFTGQVNWTRLDGRKLLTDLPRQDTYLIEAGCFFKNPGITPFAQYTIRNFDNPSTPDQNSLQVGAVWWMKGHNRNLKVSAGRLHTEAQPDRIQVLAQLQMFYY